MAKVRLADFVVDWLVKKGIGDIFLVSGGGIMHLVDAVGKNRRMSPFVFSLDPRSHE